MVLFVSVQHFVISSRLERPQSLRKEEGITIQGRGAALICPPAASVMSRRVLSAGKETRGLGGSWTILVVPGGMLHQ